MPQSLPAHPDLEQLRKQAKELLKAARAGSADALRRFRENLPANAHFALNDAQVVIAREYGFATWSRLKDHIHQLLLETRDPLDLFKDAFHADDAVLIDKLLDRYPAITPRLKEPIGPFDSPPITHVKSRAMLDVFLRVGADLNAKSRWWAGGFGLLHNAPPEVAAYAIERGAEVDIHAAARLGHLDRLHERLAADPTLVHARGGDGQTPLHFAATTEIAALLLHHGADVNARDVDHESTPAQWMLGERSDVARYLVERGAETDLLMVTALGDEQRVRQHLDARPACIHLRVDDEYFPKRNPRSGGTIYQWTLGREFSAHDVARKFGHPELLPLLLERSPFDLRLLALARGHDAAAMQALLATASNLDLCPKTQHHLAHAARDNDAVAVRLMLQAGWPVDAKGQHQGTALHWAAFHGNLEMVETILPHDPPLELPDADHKAPPLGWATFGSEHGWHRESGDYAGVVKALLRAGAKPPPQPSGTEAVQAVLRRASLQ